MASTVHFTKEERALIQNIHVLSGESYDVVQNVIESFCLATMFGLLEKSKVVVPLLGDVTIKYNKDILVKDGKEADISLSIVPSAGLKRIVGQISDEQECDLETVLKKKIRKIVDELSKQD